MTPSVNPARFSAQTRAIHPEEGADVHPRCREMAEAMREGQTRPRDLLAAGFSAAEITLHKDRAHDLALAASVRQIATRLDTMEDVIQKAREAIASRPPLPRGIEETQATLVRWSLYCQARAALTLYPWASLREQCLGLLRRYLDGSEMFDRVKNEAIAKVAESFPKVMQ